MWCRVTPSRARWGRHSASRILPSSGAATRISRSMPPLPTHGRPVCSFLRAAMRRRSWVSAPARLHRWTTTRSIRCGTSRCSGKCRATECSNSPTWAPRARTSTLARGILCRLSTPSPPNTGALADRRSAGWCRIRSSGKSPTRYRR